MPCRLLAVVLCLILPFSPGCGTVFFLWLPRGVEVSSTPKGATLTVDGVEHSEGTTPTKLGLWTGKDHVIEAVYFGEDGKPIKGQTTIGRRVRLWIIFGDILLTGGVGLLVDWLTGSMFKFEKHKVWINMGDHEAAAASVQAPDPVTPDPVTPPPATPDPVAPPPDPDVIAPDADPCLICGEPRGMRSPCPSCGAN